jgi:hypothetical protein
MNVVWAAVIMERLNDASGQCCNSHLSHCRTLFSRYAWEGTVIVWGSQSNFYTKASELRNSCPKRVLQDSSGFDIVPANAVRRTDDQHSSP